MKRALILGFVAACGAPTSAVVSNAAAHDDSTRWIFRAYSTGLVMKASTLETFTLTRTGSEATLVVARTTGTPAQDGMTWAPPITESFAGSAREDASGLHLAFTTRGGDPLTFECIAKPLRVAAHTARRIPDPAFHDECGNQGTWAPAAYVTLDALDCESALGQRAFAHPPGIERLGVDDDCIMQGADLRQIPPDGSVAPAREPEDRD